METVFNHTMALCPVCGKKIGAAVIEKDGAIFLDKRCPVHGAARALISSSAEWYRRSLLFVKPLTRPRTRSIREFTSCPDSCGLCPEHGQHTCLPVIEITSACDLNCPICLKRWNNELHMSVPGFTGVLDVLASAEGFVPVINLSGGEPTLHPQLPEMLRIAKEKGILQTSVSTNGQRLLHDAAFRSRIREYDPLIALQFDGFDYATTKILRGTDLLAEKQALIDVLDREQFKYSLVATVVRDVNAAEIPALVDFFFNSKALSLMFQPAAFTGNALSRRDPLRRLTIPDVIDLVDKSSSAKSDDFVPLPCSHPTCFALAYYFQADDGSVVGLKDLLGLENYLAIISNRTLPGLDLEGFRALQYKIYDLWSAADQFPHGEAVLKKIRLLLRELNDNGFSAEKAFALGTQSVKAIFIHQLMDKDTFDFGRLIKCCNHYPRTDGRLVPMCAQNVCFS